MKKFDTMEILIIGTGIGLILTTFFSAIFYINIIEKSINQVKGIEKNMETKKDLEVKYLIQWDDDNHDPYYWLDTEPIGYGGYDITDVIETVFKMGQENPNPTVIQTIRIGIDSSFPEELDEKLWDYLNMNPKFDEEDIKIMAKAYHAEYEQELQAWYEFYEKNKDKIEKTK